MNYKIVSNNSDLIFKVQTIFTSLNMSEAIHIQEVDFWLIDASTIDNNSIKSYKNKKGYSKLLFIVNNEEETKLCIQNGFSFYMNSNFSFSELSSWCKYFILKQEKSLIKLDNGYKLDLKNKVLINNSNEVPLTLQEVALFNAINNEQFTSTEILMNILNLTSTTSVRTIINRIRNKSFPEIIIQKRNFGYKLNKKQNPKKEESFNIDSYIKDLEDQNKLMQEIVDSSPIFIVTFVHHQLYCINKSFREFLGNDIIKELWSDSKGDFFQLIKHNSKEKEMLKKELFTTGVHEVELLNFKSDERTNFKIKTYYFENLDKHLLIFEKL